MSDTEIQQKYIELQLIEQQFKQLQQQLIVLQQQKTELQKADESLTDIKNIKPGTEILAQLSPGVFLKAELKDTKEVLMDIGARVGVKKSIAESKEIIDVQIKEIDDVAKQIEAHIEKVILHIHMIQNDIQELSKRRQ